MISKLVSVRKAYGYYKTQESMLILKLLEKGNKFHKKVKKNLVLHSHYCMQNVFFYLFFVFILEKNSPKNCCFIRIQMCLYVPEYIQVFA
jgi:hypothetical protein